MFYSGTVLLSLLLGLILFESATQLLVRTGLLMSSRPWASQDRRYVDHEEFGLWRRSNTIFRHPTLKIDYRTNSVGARDRERVEVAASRRVIVLGDSFVEGWNLPTEKRLTNLLENSTGLEHLNFAMGHFGPYQSYLVYRELGKRYTHNHVLIGILPINDFTDLDYERARHAVWYPYRPYLLGQYPDLVRFDHREGKLKKFLRSHSYGYNALAHGYLHLRADTFDPYARPLRNDKDLVQSFFHEFSEQQFLWLRYSLELLVAAAEGKQVVVFLIPAQQDFLRHHQSGEGPLYARLSELGAAQGFQVVNLLPRMLRALPRSQVPWEAYYFRDDYHWNARANIVAAKILQQELRDTIYHLPEPGMPKPGSDRPQSAGKRDLPRDQNHGNKDLNEKLAPN